ncbi:MAG: GNAT family N-acetyltransferase [Paracoccaceae bacterium]
MTRPWEQPATGPAATLAARLAELVPVLRTGRLILRAPVIGDFGTYADILMSDRAAGLGGPFDREGAWNDFCQAVAGWLLRGAGVWTITRATDGECLGFGYLWQEYGDPEPEIGWVLTAAAEGQGYAREAAEAIRAHAFGTLGWPTVVSYIDIGNTRSARLAERLGATRDPLAEAAFGEPVMVYRHMPEAEA